MFLHVSWTSFRELALKLGKLALKLGKPAVISMFLHFLEKAFDQIEQINKIGFFWTNEHMLLSFTTNANNIP